MSSSSRNFIILLIACLLLGVNLPLSALAAAKDDSCIILLHGLGRTSVSMKAVEWRLEDEGFEVVNNSYPWLNKSIEEIAPDAIEKGLRECKESGKPKVGFVTHSLGGIVLRQYTDQQVIPNISRVVMMAPPNQGSIMADDLLASKVLKPLLPEPALQLGTGEDSLPRKLGPVAFELGVIAGTDSGLIHTSGLDNVPSDGTVSVEETRVEGMQDFIVLPVDHSFLMWQSEVLDQVLSFLREGKFDHDVDEKPTPENVVDSHAQQ